ncbi:MAG: MoaD/ThiS family protein [Chitinophagaceae bacterium]
MAKVKIKFFGILKEISNQSEIEMNDVANVEELHLKIKNLFPFFSHQVYAISVNQKIVHDLNSQISDGDEIAFLPPYSGG